MASVDHLDTNGWLPDDGEMGRGANSVVYLARRGNDVAVLKVCSAWRPASERYRRFVAEIQALHDLREVPGVMEVLDSGVVDPAGKGQFPWYVMPEGVPLDRPRPGRTLDELLAGLASTAKTLQAMHELGYSHRDVKPSNLFVMKDGSYVVGDLGLVGVPKEVRESLTREGGSLGPANFMAPEMIEYASGVDARPADVYSLAKTIWSLVAGRRHPLPGHQRADDQECLVALIGDDRLAELDRLVEHATQHDPSRRPNMVETANALQNWLEIQGGESDTEERDEVTVAIAEARRRMSSQLDLAEAAAADLDGAKEAFGQFAESMNPTLAVLMELGGRSNLTQADQMLDATLGHPFIEEMGRPMIRWRNQVFQYVQIGEDYDGARLAVACAAVLYEGRTIAMAAGILVYEVPPTLGAGGFSWNDVFEASLGSLKVAQESERLAREVRANLPAAIENFSQLAERL